MMKNIKTQGLILLDVDVVALNNAGKTTSSNNENAVATKTIRKNGRSYVYASGPVSYTHLTLPTKRIV